MLSGIEICHFFVSDHLNYKKKLKLSFSVLQNNDAIIQLSLGIEGDG